MLNNMETINYICYNISKSLDDSEKLRNKKDIFSYEIYEKLQEEYAKQIENIVLANRKK